MSAWQPPTIPGWYWLRRSGFGPCAVFVAVRHDAGPDLRAQRPVTIGLAQCDKATWPSGVLCALIGHSNAQHIHVLSPPDPTIYGWWACNRCCALRLEQPR